MSAYKHLPDAAGRIAGGQGWDDNSIVIHLVGFIREQGLSDNDVADYFSRAADEENGESGEDAPNGEQQAIVDHLERDFG
jgi:hypothetical protein